MNRLAAFVGFVVIVGIGYLMCNNKKRINFKTFGWGIGLQFAFAIMVLRGPDIMDAMSHVLPGRLRFYALFVVLQILGLWAAKRFAREAVEANRRPFDMVRMVVLFESFIVFLRFDLLERFFVMAREAVTKLIDFAGAGSDFVFGTLAHQDGKVGFVFAFNVLPIIIFIASVFAVLYYLGVMQVIVRFVARLMTRFMGTSGAESMSVAASIFMGQTEAPLTIRPFLSGMTMSELMTIMTAGMAHVSGSIMAAYVAVAHVDIKHLLAAVVMTAPGSIFMSKLIVPEVDEPETGADVKIDVPVHDVNLIDAAARGAGEGGNLALNVAYMLVAFIALVALVNGLLGWTHDLILNVATWNQGSLVGNICWNVAYHMPGSLQQLLGSVLQYLALAMGVPWKDAQAIGGLLGERVVINEFVAFIDLGKIRDTLDPRSFTIATYALCGFANFSSVAIQIGGIGSLAQDRRHDLARLGLRAMIAGTLANYLTATIAGILL